MIEKIKVLPKKAKIMLTTAMMMCMTSAVALADESGMSMTTTELTSIMSSLTGVIDVKTIVGFIAAIIGVAAVFVLMWFGIRKGISAIMGAVRKGRLGV